MLIDSHLHLEQFEDVDAVHAEAIDAGVSGFVCVSQERQSMQKVLDLADRFPESVIPALGVHPVEVTRLSNETLEQALDFMADHLELADEVGEVGLDYKWAETTAAQEHQAEILTRQLDLAGKVRQAGQPSFTALPATGHGSSDRFPSRHRTQRSAPLVHAVVKARPHMQ